MLAIKMINQIMRGDIMKYEYERYRGQLKGYLFEIVIMELLRKNQFTDINLASEPNNRVRERRLGFIEFKGRGCWHQIDYPCDYNKLIPFSYPIRLLGEVKFNKSRLSKEHIREYIGVIKDIQENYFVDDGVSLRNFYPRKMEIGVYFSANGFQEEAEKLAYAHGIKTISYENNFLVNQLKVLVEEFERDYLSINCLREHNWNTFRQEIINTIRYGEYNNYLREHPYIVDGYGEIVDRIRRVISDIRSSFIGATATGVFIHFVGDSDFPYELFQHSDEGICRVYYDVNDLGKRYFWMEISDDIHRRRFYFTPPESLDSAAVFGKDNAINEKERLFHTLSVNIMMNGISRSLVLHLDEDWLNAIRCK